MSDRRFLIKRKRKVENKSKLCDLKVTIYSKRERERERERETFFWGGGVRYWNNVNTSDPPNYTAVQTHANPENKLYLLCKLAAYWRGGQYRFC